MVAWLGPAISAGASLIGGFMSKNAQEDANRRSAEAAQKNRQMQMHFAEHGIRMRVNDAKKAGIHPIYALGAQTPTYTPTSQTFTPESGVASGLAAAGQDIGRAFNATRTAPERESAFTTAMQSLQLKNAELDTQIKQTDLASRVARLSQTSSPPLPTDPITLPWGKLDPATPLVAEGTKLNLDRSWSDGSTFEDRWGEWGGSAAGLAVMVNDLLNHARAERMALQSKYPIDFSARGSFRENSQRLLGRR